MKGLGWSLINITGQIFGNLTVIRRAGSARLVRTRRNKAGNSTWLCRCSCGQEVVARSDQLRSGKRKSCAINGHVWNANPLRKANLLSYRSWCSMHKRCRDVLGKNYRNYKSRGIGVCARWQSFAFFLADMGRRPSLQHSIDRIDNDKGYEPGNCRWATAIEQRRNSRQKVFTLVDGEKALLVDVCAKLGLNRGVVYGRLKAGWSLDDALTVPVRPKRKNSTSVVK